MPIEFRKNRAVFLGGVSVEEAEGLLGWLQRKPAAKVDLAGCRHLHPATLQVLMAARNHIALIAWPEDAGLRAWLETALQAGSDLPNSTKRPS